MDDGDGRGKHPPPEDDALVFQSMVDASVKNSKPQSSKFVEKLDKVPKVSLPPSSSRKKVISLIDHGLMGQVIGIWTSPKMVAIWLEKNRKPLI